MMRMTRGTLVTGCALAMVALSGCKREATGQVAAVVNGDEITLQEVNQEIGQVELPKNIDRKAVQQAALQKIIDRRLVAQAARKEGIDKEPEYLIRQRQIDELLLIQMMGQKASHAQRMPDTAAIDKYVADHPTQFGDRTVYALDRVQFAIPANPGLLQSLKADHSMDAVIARLNAAGITFQHSAGQLDSAMVPPLMMTRIKALPAGEPFAVPENGMVTVAVVTQSKPAPLASADARPIALKMMLNDELGKVLDQRIKTARAAAKIDYQAGFAPTKPMVAAKP
jgi:EpsD family peptidyl-prolyl cis-trans isomerase